MILPRWSALWRGLSVQNGQDLARYDVGRARRRGGHEQADGRVERLFEGRHFDREVIIPVRALVSWSKLRACGDLVEMMKPNAARRWHIRPLCVGCGDTHRSSEKRWKRFAQAVGRSWRVDETDVKT